MESPKLHNLKDFTSEGQGRKEQVGPVGQEKEARIQCWAV